MVGRLSKLVVSTGVAALSFGAEVSATTYASEHLLRRLTPAGTAMPIPAWLSFCERYPAECTIDLTESAIITLTQPTLTRLAQVDKRVNMTIRGVSDLDHWGISDQWDLPTDGRGDCEDYQLLKRKLLAEAGLPRRAMRMALVNDRGEGHAILLVATNRGDFVLDDKVQSVLPWYETNYVFVKRESEASAEWVALNVETVPLRQATAALASYSRAKKPRNRDHSFAFERAWPWPLLAAPGEIGWNDRFSVQAWSFLPRRTEPRDTTT